MMALQIDRPHDGRDVRTSSALGPRDVVRVCLVDDHAIVRQTLADCLHRESWLEVVATAGSVKDAIVVTTGLRPDVVVMDYQLPDGDGITACEEIIAAAPGTRVVLFTMYRRRELAQRALGAGASGFVTKIGDLDVLFDALRTVVAGGRFIDPEVTVGRFCLSAQEIAVLALLAEGATARQVADALALSVATVRTYTQRAAKKLGARNRTEAMAVAVAEGLAWPSKLDIADNSPRTSPHFGDRRTS